MRTTELCPGDGQPCYVVIDPDEAHWRCGTAQCGKDKQAEEIVARAEAAHQQYGGTCGTEFCPILRAEIIRQIALALLGKDEDAA